MEPIVLTEFETLVVRNFESEDKRVPFDSPSTYIGALLGGNAGLVYAAKISAENYRLFACFGAIGDPIPTRIETFAQLRQWCKFSIQHPGLSEKDKRERFFAADKGDEGAGVMLDNQSFRDPFPPIPRLVKREQ